MGGERTDRSNPLTGETADIAAIILGLAAPSIAVAAVLTYRLITYWLPILPGWIYFQLLERRNYI